jgi:triphosphoribosyl-dephospho-CoA synthase
MNREAVGPAQAAFLAACRLDVAVRKPGNVSLASPGHGMQATQFLASAEAAAGPLFEPGAPVGRRIENAVAASWACAGCNTNLGIVLLCAPIAAAVERGGRQGLAGWVEQVLAGLSVDDTRAAYRAIVLANPGGLGAAPAEDVHAPPSLNLRDAMALAADRDMIARQYANGFRELFEAAAAGVPSGFPLTEEGAVAPAVQRIYLRWLARWPDSHIVRKHGEAVAQTVMRAAQAWEGIDAPGSDPAFAAWDESLKAAGINPGTSADLTVATLLLAALG